MIKLSPAESGKYIAERAKHITIKKENIKKLAEEILNNMKTNNMNDFKYSNDGHHPSPEEERSADCTFVLDVLNFCFWTPKNSTQWKVNGYTGYFGWTAAFRRALNEGYDIKNPHYYKNITEEQLKHIFRSDDGVTEAPLMSKRIECLHAAADTLLKKFDGTFEKCIEAADKSAVRLVNLIVDNFPHFADECQFEDRTVSFYKRAQILVADIWLCFDGKGLGEFYDIDKLTMFADYRVPQALVHFKILNYDNDLYKVLEEDKLLENGCREEIEIRGCSIHAIELLTEEVRRLISSDSSDNLKNTSINSILIDNYLWLYRRKYAKELEHIPFHKVHCIYY